MKDKYRIQRSGKSEWTISRLIPKGSIAARGRTAGQPSATDRWEDCAYYPRLRPALQRLFDDLIGDEQESGKILLEAIQAAEARVNEAISRLEEKESATV